MTTAIIYTRFSPRPGADECDSCETQEALCRAYCARRGYEVDQVFADRAQSGDDADRPGLWQAVESLHRGNVLVCRWRNRLARGVYLAEVIRRAVEKAGGRIEAAEEGNNGENPDDVFIQQVLAAFAERERKAIAIRTKYAMRKHQAAGRRMGRWAPYGWRIDPADHGRLIEEPAEQQVLGTVRSLLVAGERRPGTIARQLNEQGIRSRGQAWNNKTVARILRRMDA